MASSSTIFSNGVLNGLTTSNSSLFTNNRGRVPSSSLFFPSLSPEIVCNSSRLRLYHRRLPSKRFHGVPIFSCLVGESSGIGPGSGESSIPSDSSEKAEIDLKLPRRSLLVTFTCNACGERSAKLVNRVAYERGTVFVQVLMNASFTC
ncbi:OLC1v1032441C4 [Oldenlandia corymbosa var. corymbosa]|uniref:OLC1v1032441C4 n=1 Tax=Oldenlandia corymbosa var. corymbosa TaxID=529605 RepID=A0AAV1CLS9_OLDCO|nr:OLC1v1032441C4 [Oldenlandia corymbosa var. corymbosa]